ncbi:MAG: MmcQ/YjbR family DNA-binding protein [Pseudomonadota bacterium]
MSDDPIGRLRALCLALPEAEERETWDSPTFRVRDKIFAMARAREARPEAWMKAPPGAQEVLVGADPARFFKPPYMGPKGWIGIYLDPADGEGPDWEEIRALVTRSYRMIAPKRLAARLPD